MDYVEDEGQPIGVPKLTYKMLDQMIFLALFAVGAAFDRLLSRYGWDAQNWNAWRRHSFQKFLGRRIAS